MNRRSVFQKKVEFFFMKIYNSIYVLVQSMARVVRSLNRSEDETRKKLNIEHTEFCMLLLINVIN